MNKYQQLIKNYINQNRWIYYGGVIMGTALYQITLFSIMIIYRFMIDDFNVGNTGRISDYIVMLVICGAVFLVSLYLKEGISNVFTNRLEEHIKVFFAENIPNLKNEILTEKSAGDIVQVFNRITDASKIPQYIVSLVIDGALTCIMLLYIALYVQWKLLIFMVAIFFLIIAVQKIASNIQARAAKVWKKESASMSLFADTLNGLEVIKSFTMENKFKERYGKLSEETVKLELKRTDISIIAEAIGIIGNILILCGIPLFSLYLINQNQLTIGGMVIAIFLFFNISRLFGEFIGLIQKYKIAVAAREIVIEYFDTCSDENSQSSSSEGIINVNNLSFSYKDNTKVLEDINYEFPQKGLVAIVGPTGSGKTTFLSLLSGLLVPDNGYISIGDKKMTQQSLLNMVSLVTQNTFLFPVSIYENILYGFSEVKSITVDNVISSLGLSKVFESLPHGIDTVLKENGSNLSGGQRQAVSLCRAWAKNSHFILLDEPLSSQDIFNEQAINKALKEISKQKCVIIVSHRLKITEEADKIIVLDKGKIVQEGTHAQLSVIPGLYSGMLKQSVMVGE